MASFYGLCFLVYFGMYFVVMGTGPTEVFSLEGSSKFLDFVWYVFDGTLLHGEFQFLPTTEEDLERFYFYNQLKSIAENMHATTLVVNFEKSSRCAKDCWIGESIHFQPLNVFLGDIDYGKRLNRIEEKVKNNVQHNSKSKIRLSQFEEMDLIFVTLVPQTKNKEESLRRVCRLFELDIVESDANRNFVRSLLAAQVEHFIEENNREEYYKMLGFNRSPEEIIFQVEYEDAYREGKLAGFEEGHKCGFDEGHESGFDEGHKSGFDEGHKSGFDEGHESGFDEGQESGVDEGIDKIIFNILNEGIDPRVISEISKVELSRILEIKEKFGI